MKTETAEFTYRVTLKVTYCQIDPELINGEILEPEVTKDTVAEYFKALTTLAGDEGYFEEFCAAEPVDIKMEIS